MIRYRNTLARRVTLARENSRLSQKVLAAKIRLKGHLLTQKAISSIETGARVVPDYEIPLLAEALEVDPLWLLGLSDKP